MTERMVPVRKAGGGCTIVGPDGQPYSWLEHDAVTEVPQGFAQELLAIPGGGFSVAEPGEDKHEVTEPAPKADAEVTEPEPKPARPAAERPKPRAGGRTQNKLGGQ